ncbi:MAG: aminopeptidase [Haliangiales bacterium]
MLGPGRSPAAAVCDLAAARAPRRALAPLVVALLALTLSGCMESRYVVQAGFGQLELIGKSRPVDEVLEDPRTDARTRVLLQEIEHLRSFAAAHGLATQGNYRRYVELNRPAVVWFLAASEPLAFEPKIWHFPIVGSFPYLGWFDEREAREVAAQLRAEGWDTYVRRVRAYSTGGWFRDPVLSTMFSPRDDALRSLANVILHELTHANVLINDQSTFNESVASFVGDTMAEEYLIGRFGADSAEVEAYRAERLLEQRYGARLAETYKALDELYKSDRPDADKRAEKRAILAAVDAELGMRYRPNNASLVGFKTYNAGLDEFAQLYESCGRDWLRFFAAIDTLAPDSFSEPQQEDVGRVVDGLRQAGCPAAARK